MTQRSVRRGAAICQITVQWRIVTGQDILLMMMHGVDHHSWSLHIMTVWSKTMMNRKHEEAHVAQERAIATAIPEEVHFLLTFLNTRYGQQKRLHHDAWPDRVALEHWLREHDLITAEIQVTEGDYRRAIAFREALRH